MSTKTITVAEDAYDQLRALKQEDESFSEVVRRLTARRPLSELAGLLSPSEGRRVEDIIAKGRARSR
ncbi:MAG TPA: antitoxin VapB family protein [Candidatus Nanoarchaeia archaeon]|nr:antitoxin VapB family protein [Candidatus Nanoarchaeia archaeon]